MRRLFVPAEQWIDARATIEGDAHRHLARVLRARAGDTLTLFDGQGREVDAEVLSVERDRTTLALGAVRRISVAAGARIVLLQSLARGDRMDWIVQKTTELGVATIVPVAAGRSVARLGGEAAAPRRARWEKIAREAARQCGRADVPVIRDPLPLGDALMALRQEEGGGGGDGGGDDDRGDAAPQVRLALWEASRGRSLREALATLPLARALTPALGTPPPPSSSLSSSSSLCVTLLIGPEGGFAATEMTAAVDAGFEVVGLGPRILRVETAAVVAVALVQAATGGLE
jgi:16S rRNA (uracil1498-N3)-methyltransferase